MNSKDFQLKKSIEKIEGWLFEGEPELLFELANNCKGRGVIVEIGSWKGKSTICLAKGSEAGNNVKIYAIDPHKGFCESDDKYYQKSSLKDFQRNLEKFKAKKKIVPIINSSKRAAKNFKEPVELLFIDGNHEYKYVKEDFELWFSKVINGGIIAFHDTNSKFYKGPKKVIKEKMYLSENFKNIKFTASIVYGEKTTENYFKNKIKNLFALVLKEIYDLLYRIKVPNYLKKIGKKIFFLIQGLNPKKGHIHE